MRIRVIDLANNFYKDNGQSVKKDTQENNGIQELGEYCCLGYFDALGVKLVAYDKGEEIDIRKEVNQAVFENLDGKCNRKSIVCITGDDNGDDSFWAKAEKEPFLFVSLIRIKYNMEGNNEGQDNLQDFMAGIGEKGGGDGILYIRLQ